MEADASTPNNGPNILIVEDSPTQAVQLQCMLKKHGYQVTVAGNGLKALEAIGRARPAIMLSNIVMPEMDGYQLCRHIKSQKVLSDIPIILVASLSDPKDIIRALEAGANYFITKPYDETDLLSLIERNLSKRGGRRSSDRPSGVEITYGGQEYVIFSKQQETLSLLLSTYEAATKQNQELARARDELFNLNKDLERMVEERSAALREEVAERKRAEESRRESEERFRTVVESANDAIVVANAAGEIVGWNTGARVLFGYDAEEILGQRIPALMPQRYRDRHLKAMRELVLSGRTGPLQSGVEMVGLRKDGTEVAMELSLTSWATKDGTFYTAIIRDVSERKRSQEEIARFKLGIERSSEAVFMTDAGGAIVYVNPAFEKTFGYTSEEAIGKTPRILKSGTLSAEYYKGLWESLLDGKALTGELTDKTKDGRLLNIEASINPIIDGSGKTIGFLAIQRDITERKRVVTALRESEALYHDLVETSHNLIWRCDREGRFVFLNRAWEHTHGYTIEEMLGRPFTDFQTPEAGARNLAEFHRILKGGSVTNFDTTHISKSGQLIHLIFNAMPLLDSSGDIIGSQGTGLDISGLRLAEEEHRAILQTAMDGFCVNDTSGRFLEVNDAACSLLGYSREEMLTMDIQDVEALQTPEEVSARIQRIRATGSDRFESRLRRKDGSVFDVEVTANYRDLNGGRLYAFIRDVTERKKSEGALRESEERFRTIFEDAPVGTVLLSPDYKVIKVNQSLCDMLGYTCEELCELTFMDVTHPEDLARDLDLTQRLFKGEIPAFKLEKRYFKKTGEVIWTELTAVVGLDQEGNAIYVLRMLQDVTERKSAENERQKSFERLQRVMEGTIEVIAKLGEIRDPYTAGHERRVAQLATAIAREMDLPDARVDTIRIASILHDIGKISIPSEILAKPGKISDNEMRLIHTHPSVGSEILNGVEFAGPVAKAIGQHHERLDGSGYPDGLSNDSIMLEARILAVADVVEAMLSHRPYRAALGKESALEEISVNRGTQYDPVVVEACLRLFREKGFELE